MAQHRRGNFEFLNNYNYFYPKGIQWLVLFFWFLVGILLGSLVTLLISTVAGTSAAQEYGTVISYPLMFIPAMIYAGGKSRANRMNLGGLKLDNDNFAPKGGFLCAVLAMTGTLALSFCSDVFTSVLPEMPENLKALFENMTQGNIWISFLCVSIFAPIFEEWLCRGMVLRGLIGKGMNPAWAIVLSATFFAVIHANPWQAVPAFLFGCLFGYVYYRTGSLRLTMLMHFTNNTFSLVMCNMSSLEATDSWKDFLPANVYWTTFAACVIITALVVIAFKSIPLKYKDNSMEILPSMFEER